MNNDATSSHPTMDDHTDSSSSLEELAGNLSRGEGRNDDTAKGRRSRLAELRVRIDNGESMSDKAVFFYRLSMLSVVLDEVSMLRDFLRMPLVQIAFILSSLATVRNYGFGAVALMSMLAMTYVTGVLGGTYGALHNMNDDMDTKDMSKFSRADYLRHASVLKRARRKWMAAAVVVSCCVAIIPAVHLVYSTKSVLWWLPTVAMSLYILIHDAALTWRECNQVVGRLQRRANAIRLTAPYRNTATEAR